MIKKLEKAIFLAMVILGSAAIASCEPIYHDPSEIREYGSWTNVNAYFDEIELNWSESYFIHETLRIDIPENWNGWGKKSDFDDLDKHDLVYQYKKRNVTYYSGSSKIETSLLDLDHENPDESTMNFHISIVNINIDSKLLIQDELVNDYYFKYDFNSEYYNHCYFRIAKNDINQLKSGSYNEIRLDLVVLLHIDESKSFKLKTEDGITEVGYYNNLGIYFNPDLV